MTKTGIIAALLAAAAIVLVVVAAQGMSDSGFIIRAYSITAAILAGYTWMLAKRLDEVEKDRAALKDDTGE